MSTIYKKNNSNLKRLVIRSLGLLLFSGGLLAVAFFSFPLISFQIYLQPVLASQGMATPIPKATVLNENSIKSLLSGAASTLSGVDYSNARNWFPSFQDGKTTSAVTSYSLSIPKIGISQSTVSTTNNDLAANLVHYSGTTVPPNKGNAVIFGHSTLPQLYRANDYKTIFANIHTLDVGDELELTVSNVRYVYKIYNVTITEPTDTSFFAQNFDDNYLTLVTCTPPGTTWKRLVLKARMVH